MAYKLSAQHIDVLYTALREPRGENRASITAPYLRRIADEGWAHTHLMEDMLLISDRRFRGPRYLLDIEVIAVAAGIPLTSICHRPTARSSGVVLHDAWPAFEAAKLLIMLESLSFAIDPTELVARLLPAIPKRGYITSAALDVLWHEKTRGKSRIAFEREDAAGSIHRYVDHDLPGGYKLTALLSDDEKPLSLTVVGPRYRRPRPTVETTCLICGHTWQRGDPESSAYHRRIHKKRLPIVDPQPHEQVLSARSNGEFEEHVGWLSPDWRQKEMYGRASAFRREMGYDFVQWSERKTDKHAHGFLFADDEGRIVGACAFRQREYEGWAPRWAMQWVWIAKGHRRRGILSSRWSALRERFGEFHVEGPVSSDMQSFLRAVREERLMHWDLVGQKTTETEVTPGPAPSPHT